MECIRPYPKSLKDEESFSVFYSNPAESFWCWGLVEMVWEALSNRLCEGCGWTGDCGRSRSPLLALCPVDEEENLLSPPKFSFLLFVLQEAVIENRALWLLLKKTFRYHSKSHYKRLQRVLEQDSSWPPLNETFFSDSVEISVDENTGGHSNPTFDSNEDTLWRKLWRTHQGQLPLAIEGLSQRHKNRGRIDPLLSPILSLTGPGSFFNQPEAEKLASSMKP